MTDLPPPGPGQPGPPPPPGPPAPPSGQPYSMTGGFPPAPPHGGSDPRRDGGLAWTGFALALVVCVPLLPLVGAVLGLVTLIRGRAPRWIGVVALVVGLLATAGQALVVAGLGSFVEGIEEAADREADDAREGGDPAEVRTLDLEQGDCLDDPALAGAETEATESETVTLTSCASPHGFEVYAVLQVSGDDYPGEAAIDTEAEGCFPRFLDFVGTAYAESDLEVYYYFPTERSWDLLGDRSILCLVTDPAGAVTGSLEGARR
jgi:hypothetical protein